MRKKVLYRILAVISAVLLFWSAGYDSAGMLYDRLSGLLYALGLTGLFVSVRGLHRIDFLTARHHMTADPHLSASDSSPRSRTRSDHEARSA